MDEKDTVSYAITHFTAFPVNKTPENAIYIRREIIKKVEIRDDVVVIHLKEKE